MQTTWLENENSLSKTFKFSSFLKAMEWMQAASILIERENHHPKWINIYNKVMVELYTHDAGNRVTDKDRQLATLLDSIPIK